VQVHAAGAWAMVMVTPLLKGSIFEEGTVSMTWEGDEMDSMNSTQLLVMWMLGSKILPAWMVNSPHLRNPANAVVAAVSKLSQPSREEWVVDASMCMSMSHVMGSLGIRLCSRMYLFDSMYDTFQQWGLTSSECQACIHVARSQVCDVGLDCF